MTNPNQLLCNVLEECGLPNTAAVAAKLIDEEVSWNDITEAHGSRGDIGVHNLLTGIVKTGGRAKIVKYLDQAQENAASSGAGGHTGGSSSGSSSSSASSTTSEKVTLAITVMQGLKTLIPRRAVTVSREMTFVELAASVVDEGAPPVAEPKVVKQRGKRLSESERVGKGGSLAPFERCMINAGKREPTDGGEAAARPSRQKVKNEHEDQRRSDRGPGACVVIVLLLLPTIKTRGGSDRAHGRSSRDL